MGENFWAVGTSLPGDAWMFEGLFTTEELAVAACEQEMFVVYPCPLNKLTAKHVKDCEIIYWPHYTNKEEGLVRLNEYRKSLEEAE